jgi:ATP-binding cassette subfamily F protein 3
MIFSHCFFVDNLLSLQALNMFEGAVVLVSHDERLITTVCTDLWVCKDGKVSPFNGDFEAYKKIVEAEFI